MRRSASRLVQLLLFCAVFVATEIGAAKGRTHVVARGQTLGAIAKRYNVSIDALCSANRISRRAPIRPGQELTIPAPGQKRKGPKVHVVGPGGTLSEIAKHYGVTVSALCNANGIGRRDPIRPGQELVIPDKSDEDGSAARRKRSSLADDAPKNASEPSSTASKDGLQTLLVPGAPPAYYYEPIGPGRLSLRPVIMYLHGRGGNPAADCRRWARVARALGWMVCPSGPADRGGGGRGWNNNWAAGQRIVMQTLNALRAKYGRRVQLYGNTIAGFSEGAFVAMNVGVREPRAFNRWLILAADSSYWGGAGIEALEKRHATVRRVYLITGKKDAVSDSTEQVRAWLRRAGVPARITMPADMGHELALGKKPELYRAALMWLQSGSSSSKRATSSAKRTSGSSKRER